MKIYIKRLVREPKLSEIPLECWAMREGCWYLCSLHPFFGEGAGLYNKEYKPETHEHLYSFGYLAL